MIRVKEAIVVEGKYDKIKLSSLVEGVIIETKGFGIFQDREKLAYLRALAKKRGLIVLTDSDGAGFLIRWKLSSSIPPEQIKHAYIPDILGKERRKAAPGKEGLLGVEGVPDELIRKSLRDALGPEAGPRSPAARPGRAITYVDLYDWGLSGTAGAAERKYRLLEALGLPPRLSKKEMLEVFNRLYTFEQLDALVQAAGEG